MLLLWTLLLGAYALHLPFDRAVSLSHSGQLEAWVQTLPPGISGVVLDLKTIGGRVGVPFQHPLAAQTGAYDTTWDLRPAVSLLRQHGLRVIARVAVLRDSLLYEVVPSPYIRWFTPTNTTALAYNRAVLRAVAALPIQEIQLDYVRWPDTRKPKTEEQKQWRRRTLRAFVERLLEGLPDSLTVSADLFGRTCFLTADENDVIGQHPLDFLDLVDVLCPMMYPSHYWGALKDPYQAVYQSSLALLALGVPPQRLRPWLQAFPMRLPDTVDLVGYLVRQLEALQDVGLTGAMFWLPNEDAVRQALAALGSEEPEEERVVVLHFRGELDPAPFWADTLGQGTGPGPLVWRRHGRGLALYWRGYLCRLVHLNLQRRAFRPGLLGDASGTWLLLWTRENPGLRPVTVLQVLRWPGGDLRWHRRIPALVLPDSAAPPLRLRVRLRSSGPPIPLPF